MENKNFMALTEDELYDVNGGYSENLKSVLSIPEAVVIELSRKVDLGANWEKKITKWECASLRRIEQAKKAEEKRRNEFRGIR